MLRGREAAPGMLRGLLTFGQSQHPNKCMSHLMSCHAG